MNKLFKAVTSTIGITFWIGALGTLTFLVVHCGL